MLKGGLVGFGAVAEKAHLPAFAKAEGLSLVAVADPARKAPNLNSYPGFDEMLAAEKLDFVVICTPPNTHAALARRALAEGLKVLVEKPLTLDPRELDALRGVSVVHNWAYAPIWRKAFELGRGARHAEIHVLRTQPSVSALPGDWRKDLSVAGGGILVDHGWHALYLLRRLLGGRAEVTGLNLKRAPSGTDDEADLRLRFSTGATARIHLTWRAAERSNWALIKTDSGDIELRDDHILAAGKRHDFGEKLSQGSAHPDWNAAMLPDVRAEFEGRSTRSYDEARFCCEIISEAYRELPA